MEILKGIEIKGLSLILKKARKKILVLADLHIGYEYALNKQGILVPRQQFKETLEKLKKIFDSVGKIDIVVINGDLKHEFGEISNQEWSETLKIFDFLSEKCKKIILIKGNHDTILEPLAKKRNLEIKEFVCFDDLCILHGDKILLNKEIYVSKILIIGHEHPAISLQEGAKQEIYKCFLLGKWKDKKLIIQPSFLPIIEGTDIKRERLLSPYLQQNLKNFETFIIADRVYRFGKLKNIK
ncbi:metallophosphoesterase [Candidatus Pacearchaeota archaeon]|nr:metallophosphoesterase [Candidatus Pacearchaeota archaeon]